MSKVIVKFWNEPVVFIGSATAILAAASGVWQSPWLSFGTAVFAGLGTIFVRQNVSPVNPRKDG